MRPIAEIETLERFFYQIHIVWNSFLTNTLHRIFCYLFVKRFMQSFKSGGIKNPGDAPGFKTN